MNLECTQTYYSQSITLTVSTSKELGMSLLGSLLNISKAAIKSCRAHLKTASCSILLEHDYRNKGVLQTCDNFMWLKKVLPSGTPITKGSSSFSLPRYKATGGSFQTLFILMFGDVQKNQPSGLSKFLSPELLSSSTTQGRWRNLGIKLKGLKWVNSWWYSDKKPCAARCQS